VPTVPKQIGDGPIKMALLEDTQTKKENKRCEATPEL